MNWTEENKVKLAELYLDKSDAELAEYFGTSVQAIKTQRRRQRLLREVKTIRNTKKYTYCEVKELFENRNYQLVSTEYVNYTTKMRYICNEHSDCGEQRISLCDFLRGRGCTHCGRERTTFAKRVSVDEIVSECKEKDFTFVDIKIKNKSSYIYYICNKHPEVGVQNKFIGSFRRAINCPHCKESRGETAVRNVLESLSLEYTSQKRFSECRDKYTLPFDFYIEKENIAIEYDGELHYMPVPLRLKKAAIDNNIIEDLNCRYEEQIRRDKIKNDYCEKNGIILIRISYTRLKQINTILPEILTKLINPI